jgi:hypothetical protein
MLSLRLNGNPALARIESLTSVRNQIMAIDNPRDAFRQHYMQEEPSLPNKLAKYAAVSNWRYLMADWRLRF